MTDRSRCSWCNGDPLLTEYHDTEWGIPPGSDDEYFERMSMQIFQAGLNWRMILGKREALNRAFLGFRINRVARFDGEQIERLLSDPSIIRNRRKVESVVRNAVVFRAIAEEHGSFSAFLDALPAKLPVLQKELRRRFAFMGPEVTRMFVFNVGKLSPPHDPQCWRH